MFKKSRLFLGFGLSLVMAAALYSCDQGDLVDAPQAPAGLTATVISGTQVQLDWMDVSTDEDGFLVKVKEGNSDNYLQIGNVGVNQTTYTDSDVDCDETYTYEVLAFNAGGYSEPSNEAMVTTWPCSPDDSGLPGAPTDLQAVMVGQDNITLFWTDNSVDETGFRIERKDATGIYTQAGDMPADVTSYQDAGLACGTVYSYRVCAYNERGDSRCSDELSVQTEFCNGNGLGPEAPTFLGAVAISGTEIDLAWIDNSSDESGFMVERKTGTDGIYEIVYTIAADTTYFSDYGLVPGTTYFYRVYAFNAEGISGASNEAMATTTSEIAGQVVAVHQISAYELSDGDIMLIGELQNIGESDATFVKITFTFLDSSGAFLGSDYTYVYGTNKTLTVIDSESDAILVPGETGAYVLYPNISYQAVDPSQTTYTIEWDNDQTVVPDADITVSDWSSSVTSDSMTVSGTVINNGTEIAIYGEVYVFYRDSEDNVIDWDFTYIDGQSFFCRGGSDNSSLAPGSSATFLTGGYTVSATLISSFYMKTAWNDYTALCFAPPDPSYAPPAPSPAGECRKIRDRKIDALKAIRNSKKQ